VSGWARLAEHPGPGDLTVVADRPASRGPEGSSISAPSDRGPTRRWWAWLSAITLLGFGIRLATVLGRPDRRPGGDAYYFHNAANLLVGGHGFIDPWHYNLHPHQIIQTADWPPLFVFVLAATSVVGLKSFFAHRVWCCIIGAAAVTVCGLTGREIAGRRAGLIAAFLVAVYPNIWMSDELALSETLSPLLVALVLLCAYRFWKRPGMRRVLVLGAVLGVAMLGRDELALLVPFILLPLALLARLSWRTRLALAGMGTLTALAVVAPWVGYNMSRFQKPTFISSGLGITLASANCDQTWSGYFEGYWSLPCSLRTPLDKHADKSVQSAEAESYALHYVRTHEGRLVRVELARLGRAFGAFHPMSQVQLDYYVETRPYHWALVGLGMYYALLPLALGGTVVLLRRRVPVFPLWAIGVDVAATVMISFGQTRYRTTFEVSLVLLAAVLLDWFWSRAWVRRLPADVVRGTSRHAGRVLSGSPAPADAAR
jgi:4-amino-4-deoxy-L-arabinose transferase-like glycosyltransferase